jgi:DNA-binding NtrC family response regulator
MSNILLIEESRKWLNHFKKALVPPHDLDCWSDEKDIGTFLKQKEYAIILLGLQLEKLDSFGLLKRVKVLSSHTPVVAISEIDEPSLIVKAVKDGCFDFITKPFLKEKIQLSIQRALENRHLRHEIDYLRHEQDVVYEFDRIIARSPCMKQTIVTLKKFSRTDSTILMTGETGTGKSFLSGAIHFNSHRQNNPFIKINCANIPESLLESELFGHERGAFTGANKTRAGRLEQGKGGTVFLDEIGEMSLGMQAKMLGVLEEKSFERVGGNKRIHSDVRIIAATNKNPERKVAEGAFREDLYYRLNILRIHLPPLRERKECIKPLAYHFLNKACRNVKKKIEDFSPEALEVFKSYSWPGNIRQLANTIERAVILEESHRIQIENIILSEPIKRESKEEAITHDYVYSLANQERAVILSALEESLWVQKEAARLLGITPRALNYKVKKLGITHPHWRKNI